jgi:hypothetical protein
MADTFSTSLKARKIEQGGYDPAWASRFNADVIDILDAAISGRVSISIGSSTTPSLAALQNGTLSDSHYLWLVFTGTPASAVTLTVPASVTFKQYLIDNQTGQTMTVKYAATAGVQVPTGKVARVLCDGTTVIEYTGSISSEFTGTLTGCTTSPTGTIRYTKNGDHILVPMDGFISATSNTTAATITGAPSIIWPVRTQAALARVIDNGTTAVGIVEISTAGVFTLFANAAGGAFTASGTKGINRGAFSYSLA